MLVHIPEKVSLLGLAVGTDANVWQQLFLQDVLGILDPLLPGHTGLGPTDTNEVQGHVLLLDHEGLVQRWLQLRQRKRNGALSDDYSPACTVKFS